MPQGTCRYCRDSDERKDAMDILPTNFKIFKVFGLWSEVNEGHREFSSTLRKVLTVGLIFHFTVTQTIELILNKGGVDSLTERLLLATTFVSMCCKVLNFLLQRGEISKLLGYFRQDLLKFQNPVEEKILTNCRSRCTRCVVAITCLSQLTCFALLVKPFLVARDAPSLPFRTYQLYDTSSSVTYVTSYLIQATSVIISVFLNVSCDTLVYGFILQATAQLDILSFRLGKLIDAGSGKYGGIMRAKDARNSLGRCVEHHVLIREAVGKIERLFGDVISVLFISSLITLCTTIYQISKQSLLSVESIALGLYLTCMLFQTFFYCYYGNELRSKSRNIGDTVYKSNWIQSSPNERKTLRLIIIMSQRELNVSCNGIFSLSLSTFMWIIRTSYTAFNLLQQISN